MQLIRARHSMSLTIMRPKLRFPACIWLLFLLIATPSRVACDQSSPDLAVFSVLGTREGLSNSSVSSIAQDRDGFLWFGTQGGLDQYDGHSFKVFESEPFNPNSLAHNQVQTLYMDDDILWAGTYGGLSRLDLVDNGFTTYRRDAGREDSLSNDVVTAIVRDARGRLWVGTLGGLNRLDEKTGSFRRYLSSQKPGSIGADTIRALHIDRRGRLWVGTSGGGLALFDYDTESFRVFRKIPGQASSILSDFVMAIDEDLAGSLWIGTWYGGISRLDPETGLFENHPTSDERVYTLSTAEPGIIYVGTWGGGLLEYDVGSGKFTGYRASGGLGSLSHDVVYSILRDRSGELWFGTNGGGIDKLSRARRSYGALEASAQASSSFPKGKVYAINLDSRGELWVGVYNGGLAVRNHATGIWKTYRKQPGLPRSLPNDIVNFIHEDGRGRIWAGTNDGLARFDPERGDFDVWRPGPGKTGELSSEIIYAMAEDPEDGIWVGTFRSGLDRLDIQTGRVEHFPSDPKDPTSLSDNLVFALEYDSRGRLWVGTNNGLNRLAGRGFVRYFYDPAKRTGISNDSIRTIFRDSLGVLWFGTAGGGLMRYEPETDSFLTYTKKEGLPSNTVVRILEDGLGELWIATQSGIAIYDRKTGTFRSLTVYNDLRNREFYTGAFRDPEGSLYFGALDSIYRFDPGRYEYNTHRPPVLLTSVRRPGRDEPIAVAASRLRQLELGWKDNSIEFGYAALDFRDPDRNQYAYRLEGFDHEWIPAGDRHWASYTNLPAGSYVFRVKASNNDGLWNEEGLRLPVHVGGRPWTSPLALVLYAFLIALAAALFSTRVARSGLATVKAALAQATKRSDEIGSRLERFEAYDHLTATLDRGGLDDRLERDIARARSEGESVAVLMVDVDSFSAYNDSRGRQAGDEALRRIAACLTASLERSTDSITRYAGAKFLVFIANADIETALQVAERLRAAVEGLAISLGDTHSGILTVSVGCAAIRPELGLASAVLVTAAESALYQAKQGGRNRVMA